MTPTITVLERSPDGGQGLARDMPVRWALEEAGQQYEVRPVSFKAMKEPAHLARHPFGQIPTYEEDGLALFESGAIVLHIAQHSPGLLPRDANAGARAVTWMFAALSTIEPPIVEREMTMLLERDGGAQEGEPDEHEAGQFFGDVDARVEHVAQHHVAEDHDAHGRQAEDHDGFQGFEVPVG